MTGENGIPPRKTSLVQQDYWDARLSENWGLHGVGSLAYGRAWNRWLYRVRSHAFADACRRSGRNFAGRRVLDIGSGTGFYVSRWREFGVSDLVGLDFSAFAVSRLRERFPEAEFMVADIGEEAVPLPQESFDAVPRDAAVARHVAHRQERASVEPSAPRALASAHPDSLPHLGY